MRPVSSKMYRMRQCALHPRPARPAPPRLTGCFLPLHLETPTECHLPPPEGPRPPPPTPHPDRPRARWEKPGRARGKKARGMGLWASRGRRGGGKAAMGTGRPGSRAVGSPGSCAFVTHSSARPGAASFPPAPFKASLESS
ncbi:translation initiation factor IF-2-like [Zalophus californianus]|uniref:Translation initiation factor IF-2-like n=1 Tax=Zalophus californianus TaxID=9704 RepID=A0A6J2CAX8_ZALCA|nr:translation initiation factor IF-2-like [Zalophus californianus]